MKILSVLALLTLCGFLPASSVYAQTPSTLLHQFVQRPLPDNEKLVTEVSGGCMAMAEAPDDDWDRFRDLLEHNKNEYAADLGFRLLQCRNLPDRVEDLRAALGDMLENDPRLFLTTMIEHPFAPGDLPVLLASVKRTETADRVVTMQRRLDRVETVHEPELKDLRDRVAAELRELLKAASQDTSR